VAAGIFLCSFNLERLGLLGAVRMLCARKYVQLPKHAAAQGILRQHALHRKLDRALRVLIKELAQRDRLMPPMWPVW